MFLNKDRQSFTKAVAILTVLQGAAWFGLAITGIVIYYSPPEKLTDKILSYEKYSDYLGRIIYDDFMGEKRERVIRPTDFAAFLWIYAIISALWIAVSLDHYTAIRQKKSRQSVSTLVLGVLLLLTCVIDLIFVSLLARDLDTCPFDLIVSTTSTPAPTVAETFLSAANGLSVLSPLLDQTSSMSLRTTGSTTSGTEIDCQLANGIIMTIAARGFVMWAINVVLAISLIVIGAKVLRTPSLLTYGHNRIPRVKTPESRKLPSPSDNVVFVGDNEPVFAMPPPSSNRNRNTMPASLANKNQSIYF